MTCIFSLNFREFYEICCFCCVFLYFKVPVTTIGCVCLYTCGRVHMLECYWCLLWLECLIELTYFLVLPSRSDRTTTSLLDWVVNLSCKIPQYVNVGKPLSDTFSLQRSHQDNPRVLPIISICLMHVCSISQSMNQGLKSCLL